MPDQPTPGELTTAQKINQWKRVKTIIGTHPWIFVAGALLVLAAGLFFVAVVPAVRALQPGGMASVSDAQQALESARSVAVQRNRVIDSIAGISEADREKITYSMPSEQDVPGMLVQLNQIGIMTGLAITGIDITVTDARLSSDIPGTVKTMDLSVNVQGIDYPRLKYFLDVVQKNMRLLDLHGVNFGKGSDISLNMRTYFMSNKNEGS